MNTAVQNFSLQEETVKFTKAFTKNIHVKDTIYKE